MEKANSIYGDIFQPTSDGNKDKVINDALHSKDDSLENKNFPLPVNINGEEVWLTNAEALLAIKRGLAFDRLNEQTAFLKGDERLKILETISAKRGVSQEVILTSLFAESLFEGLNSEFDGEENVPSEKLSEAITAVCTCKEKLTTAPRDRDKVLKQRELEDFLLSHPDLDEIPPEALEKSMKTGSLQSAFDSFIIQGLTKEKEDLMKTVNSSQHKLTAMSRQTPTSYGDSVGGLSGEDINSFFRKLW